MSATLLLLLQRTERRTRRLHWKSKREYGSDVDTAMYPRDYYRPADRRGLAWLREAR